MNVADEIKDALEQLTKAVWRKCPNCGRKIPLTVAGRFYKHYKLGVKCLCSGMKYKSGADRKGT